MEGGASKKRKRGPGKSGVSVGELPLKQRQSHATKIPAAAKSRVTPVARPGPMTRTRSGSLPGAGASAVAVGSSEDKAPVVCGACLGPFEGGYDPRSHTNKCYRCARSSDAHPVGRTVPVHAPLLCKGFYRDKNFSMQSGASKIRRILLRFKKCFREYFLPLAFRRKDTVTSNASIRLRRVISAAAIATW
eukprot:CAMPEP_0119123718 /NCGR_PEP_ID=MMETSP1310-20130426/3574_1 /TAXON_ID=464262 /ORGANISM="Genus nov. species nov., Strain RCC2339" /LENGTH=189 /DNA_ID=CAMNT_0007113577 /DNA_START=58 /DNA_END=624 /DNA_ORIENTATION=-